MSRDMRHLHLSKSTCDIRTPRQGPQDTLHLFWADGPTHEVSQNISGAGILEIVVTQWRIHLWYEFILWLDTFEEMWTFSKMTICGFHINTQKQLKCHEIHSVKKSSGLSHTL